MDKYDYIVIGSEMCGLSAANFLAEYGKSVLLLEKHNKPGGLITSFNRNGTSFDIGIESLHELEQNETIQQFLFYLFILHLIKCRTFPKRSPYCIDTFFRCKVYQI